MPLCYQNGYRYINFDKTTAIDKVENYSYIDKVENYAIYYVFRGAVSRQLLFPPFFLMTTDGHDSLTVQVDNYYLVDLDLRTYCTIVRSVVPRYGP